MYISVTNLRISRQAPLADSGQHAADYSRLEQADQGGKDGKRQIKQPFLGLNHPEIIHIKENPGTNPTIFLHMCLSFLLDFVVND